MPNYACLHFKFEWSNDSALWYVPQRWLRYFGFVSNDFYIHVCAFTQTRDYVSFIIRVAKVLLYRITFWRAFNSQVLYNLGSCVWPIFKAIKLHEHIHCKGNTFAGNKSGTYIVHPEEYIFPNLALNNFQIFNDRLSTKFELAMPVPVWLVVASVFICCVQLKGLVNRSADIPSATSVAFCGWWQIPTMYIEG